MVPAGFRKLSHFFENIRSFLFIIAFKNNDKIVFLNMYTKVNGLNTFGTIKMFETEVVRANEY